VSKCAGVACASAATLSTLRGDSDRIMYRSLSDREALEVKVNQREYSLANLLRYTTY
jgi:hypothetical protein